MRRWLGRELAPPRPEIAAGAPGSRPRGGARYRPHFEADAHAGLVLFHGLSSGPRLRQSYATGADCPHPRWAALSGRATDQEGERGVSFSQSLRRLQYRAPAAAFRGGLIPALVARGPGGGHAGPAAVPAAGRLLDGAFPRVSRRLAPWLDLAARPKRPGMGAQARYTPALDLPAQGVLTDAHPPAVRGLDQALLDDRAHLAAWRDQTLSRDRGYYSHTRLARLLDAAVHVVTRPHPRAALPVAEAAPVPQPLPGRAPPAAGRR